MSCTTVQISEVGPRDGLQNCTSIMPTHIKKQWVSALFNAGLKEIEVGSFVSSKLIPQLADTEEIVSHAVAIKGLDVAVLIPNLRGAEKAIECGVHKITLPLSVSETHSIRNIRRTHDEVIMEVREIRNRLDLLPGERQPVFEGSLSTAFGCTIEGRIPLNVILRCAERLMDAGCDEVGLSDTTGYADPRAIKHLIREVQNVVGVDKLTSVHLHNTRGLGLANALAAYEEGITTFDSSLGGIGGCPTSPGAGGNIVTEDLVFMFESMGVDTGIDLETLVATREYLTSSLPNEELYGHLPQAGLPLGFNLAHQVN